MPGMMELHVLYFHGATGMGSRRACMQHERANKVDSYIPLCLCDMILCCQSEQQAEVLDFDHLTSDDEDESHHVPFYAQTTSPKKISFINPQTL
jgi:hypothetical protein